MLDGHVAIITPTCGLVGRNRMLLNVLTAIKSQRKHPFKVTHIVVADGDSRNAKTLTKELGAIFSYVPKCKGTSGSGPRTKGVKIAQNHDVDWYWFCDDDITVMPDALQRFASADDADLVIARIQDWRVDVDKPVLIPKKLEPASFVDTACMFVRSDLVSQVSWLDYPGTQPSDRWYQACLLQLNPRVVFVDHVVARHISACVDGDPEHKRVRG